MKRFFIISLLVFIFHSIDADAANRFVRQGATGLNNGTDWTNAYTTLPSTLSRGDTYYIADGSYGNYTFNTAVNGTQLITIKKCTTTDGVSSATTGYVSTMCDGQASFGTVTFATSYWELNGQTRNENNWQETASYGFRVNPEVVVNASVGYITVKYADIGGTQPYPSAVARGLDFRATGGSNKNNLTFHRVHIHHNVIPIHSRGSEHVTIEYSHIGPGFGKEMISHQHGGNWVLRWNKFIDSCVWPTDEGCTAIIGVFDFTGGNPNNVNAHDWEIYGNIFGGSGSYNMTMSDGIISLNASNNWKVYNNNFSHLSGNWSGSVMLNGSGHSIRNNLWYWMGNYDQNYGSIISASGSSNSWCYYKNTKPARLGSDCSTLPGVKYLGSEDPFINEPAGDYRLKASFSGTSPKDKGVNLGSPYNTDMFGNVRGADGAWDIGAFEFSSGTLPFPGNPGPLQ